jgi:sensor histidine kinase YesM
MESMTMALQNQCSAGATGLSNNRHNYLKHFSKPLKNLGFYCILKIVLKLTILRGVIYMGLMFTTVIGFMVCLGLTAMFTMHYLSSAMISADSTKIDPKPDTNF